MRQLMYKVLAHTISFFFFFVRSCSARPRSGHNFIVLAEPHDLSKFLHISFLIFFFWQGQPWPHNVCRVAVIDDQSWPAKKKIKKNVNRYTAHAVPRFFFFLSLCGQFTVKDVVNGHKGKERKMHELSQTHSHEVCAHRRMSLVVTAHAQRQDSFFLHFMGDHRSFAAAPFWSPHEMKRKRTWALSFFSTLWRPRSGILWMVTKWHATYVEEERRMAMRSIHFLEARPHTKR